MGSNLSDIFGAPGTGVHSVRLGGVAVIDVALSLMLALCIALATQQSLARVTLYVFAARIALHRLFNVRTTVDRAIFD